MADPSVNIQDIDRLWVNEFGDGNDGLDFDDLFEHDADLPLAAHPPSAVDPPISIVVPPLQSNLPRRSNPGRRRKPPERLHLSNTVVKRSKPPKNGTSKSSKTPGKKGLKFFYGRREYITLEENASLMQKFRYLIHSLKIKFYFWPNLSIALCNYGPSLFSAQHKISTLAALVEHNCPQSGEKPWATAVRSYALKHAKDI